MIHLTETEIFEIASKVSSGEKLNENELNAIKHMKECEACYEKFCVAFAVCDATSDDAIETAGAMESREYEEEPIDTHLSVIKVIRKTKGSIQTAILEQVKDSTAVFTFEPAPEINVRGDGEQKTSEIVTLEEADDKQTFIIFDSQKNELYVQIHVDNRVDTDIVIYLLFADNRVREVSMTREGDLLQGRTEGLPEGDFRIYLEKE